jgi:ATP-dependent DNA ligase
LDASIGRNARPGGSPREILESRQSGHSIASANWRSFGRSKRLERIFLDGWLSACEADDGGLEWESGAVAHWVEPRLVAEITHLTWTADNLLRHTVYVGLREDKPAKQVRREY